MGKTKGGAGDNDSDSAVNIMDKIKDSLEKLVTLEIITTVGQVDVSIEDKKIVVNDIIESENCKTILTTIDLLQGDIQTVYAPEFVTGEYQVLREFHKSREEQGHKIIQDNIKTLKNLFLFAKGIFDGSLSENKKEVDQPSGNVGSE